MSVNSEGRLLLDRVVTLHRSDCDLLKADIARDEGMPEEIEISNEQVLAYSVSVRREYDALKRIIGQLSGFLVLAQTSQQKQIFDLPSLQTAREHWSASADAIESIKAPGRLKPHLDVLRRASRLIRACLDDLERIEAIRQAFDFSLPIERLKAAYQLLQAASDSRAGMTMVDFRHACCSCAQKSA
jgi:hypothetical protein